jgi:hypothetical protein
MNSVIVSVLYIQRCGSESLETFWVKILKFFDTDPDPGSGIFCPLIQDPGWKKFGSGILDKNPGSATLFIP